MNESTIILTGVQINTPIYWGMKSEYYFVHPMVDEFCRAAEFGPTPGETPLLLVAGKGPFQRTVTGYHSLFHLAAIVFYLLKWWYHLFILSFVNKI